MLPDVLYGFIFGGAILPWLATTAVDLYNQHRARRSAKYLSDTAYTRSVRDLRAAGLSPLLAYGSPASTPVIQPAQSKDLGHIVSSARKVDIDKVLAGSQVQLQGAQAANLGALTEKAKAETAVARTQQTFLQKHGALYDAEKQLREREFEYMGLRGPWSGVTIPGLLGSMGWQGAIGLKKGVDLGAEWGGKSLKALREWYERQLEEHPKGWFPKEEDR